MTILGKAKDGEAYINYLCCQQGLHKGIAQI